MRKLYVAYGSNLNLEQMGRRCPTARIYGTGKVCDYTLEFRGSLTGAYATIIPKPGDYVPVLVWEIGFMDEANLDRYEGFPTFYYKKYIRVKLDTGSWVWAMVYIMFDEASVGLPTMYYLETCSEGYLENKLDMRKFEQFVARNRRQCLVNAFNAPKFKLSDKA